jgi:glycosyltransferase involved in cell wall biosynthesis
MRILYFSTDYTTHDHRFLIAITNGGHETYYVRLERGLRQVEDRSIPSQVEQVQWAGGQGRFRWQDLPRLVFSFRGLVKKIKPDLIHAGPIQTCSFIAVLSGFRPLLTMSWGFDLMEDVHKNRAMEWITRYVLARSDYFTSDADVTRNKAVQYGMDPGRTVVFAWGVDLQHFSVRTSRVKNAYGFTLFCNRSWELRYGVDVLARAFVKVAQQNENVNLILLGGGSQGGHIRQILLTGGVLERVTFGGQVSQRDLPYWYHLADLYVSPSHIDGSSVSLMEALACGLPVLVSDIPANREWVEAGVNGWLFPDGDADALAGMILSAIAQRQSLPEIGRAGRRSAERQADWSKNAETLMKAYETIVTMN